jgi:HAE1 family hydrophobic/amphiphilic exporter-1
MLTLFTTPVVYLYLDRAHYWYMSRKEARAAKKAAKAGQAGKTDGHAEA